MNNLHIIALCENLHRVNKKIRREIDKELGCIDHGFNSRLYSNILDLTNHSDTMVMQIEQDAQDLFI
jgi:hypothetical protein